MLRWVFLTLLLVPVALAQADGFAKRQAALLARLHSHNDYQQKRPLQDALDLGYSSVEADLWLHHHQLKISHIGLTFKGTLEKLYLQPLQTLVDQRGSVYGDGKPFILWLDLKGSGPEFSRELARVLQRYPMLTRFTDSGITPGAVTAILTGKEEPKEAYVNGQATRYACRDSKEFSEQDPSADNRWRWYAIEWRDWMRDGSKLAALAQKIHARGKRLRLWAMPGSEESWIESLAAGVDLVGVDDLPRAHRLVAELAEVAAETDAHQP